MTVPSLMEAETREAPEAVARLLDAQGPALRALGRRLAGMDPPVVATCARGSSDHAAGYLKYLLEIMTGVPVASIGPSVASVYGSRLRLRGAVQVSVSQSGRSPDLLALQAAARAGGALTVALVNDADSPLAAGADILVPLQAGPERSVAATKSFVCSVVAMAALVAAWAGDDGLARAVAALPDALRRALDSDWSAAGRALAGADSLYVLGRGPALPIAQEAALKCKETASLHAEAFSTAEVLHGPLRLVHHRLPVLAFVPDDAALPGNRQGLARIVEVDGRLLTASCAADPMAGPLPGERLMVPPTGHGFTDPIAGIVAFYRMIEVVARDRGHDPDRPANLRKVTETI